MPKATIKELQDTNLYSSETVVAAMQAEALHRIANALEALNNTISRGVKSNQGRNNAE